MTARAVVIAIQEYPDAAGLASKQLPGTHEAARRFTEWLRSHGVEEGSIWVNTDDPSFPGAPGRVRDGRAESIRATFEELVPEAAGGTGQLFVFFSGHGFVRTDLQFGPGGPVFADVLVAADFRRLAVSGGACFPLDGLQQSLRTWLGPGDHYYFVDACRNECRSSEVSPGGLLLAFPPVPGDPGVFTLFSTQRGFAAGTESGFAGHVVDGLRGRSRAKCWHGESLVVLFGSLQEYVAAQMTAQRVQYRVEARGEGRICAIEPVPQHHCDLTVEGAAAGEQVSVEVEGLRPTSTSYAATFTGPSHRFSGPPDDYWVRVAAPSAPPRAGRARIDLYEPCQVSVRLEATVPMRGEPAPAAAAAVTRAVRYGGTGQVHVELVSRADDTVRVAVGPEGARARPGSYRAVVTDARNGMVLGSRDVEVEPGTDVELDALTRWTVGDRPRLALLAQLPYYARHPDAVELSESVGPIADGDVDVWLAMVGASRIVGGDPHQWEKLGQLDLFDATTARAGDAPVYVLGTLDLPGPLPRVAASLWPGGDRVAARAVPGLDGWFEAVLPAGEGAKLLTLEVEGQPPRTTVTHCLANRTTLVTFSAGAEGPPALRQYLLLMGHLLDRVPAGVLDRLAGPSGRSPLDWVRFAAQCQRAFSRHQAIEPTGPDLGIWQELIDGKWVDPVMGVVAAYELVRAGDLPTAGAAIANLTEWFPTLPDLAHLQRLVGRPAPLPASPPLVRDGAIGLGFTSYAEMPESRLDWTSPWTSWHATPEPVG